VTILRVLVSLLAMSFVPLPAVSQTAEPIQPSFFGMIANDLRLSRPLVSFGAFRFWSTGTGWEQIEPVQGQFDFRHFDEWVSFISDDPHFKGTEAVFVLGPATPPWASSDPEDQRCDFYQQHKVGGQCYPPKDVAKDGSGTDQMWKDWVTAIAKHAAASRIHVKYWEIWNAFNNDPKTQGRNWEWAGTPQQLMRLAEDARCTITGRGHVQGEACTAKAIDPGAIILSPSFSSQSDPLHLGRARAYFNQPGAAEAAEEIAIHNYNYPPEDAGSYIALLKTALPQIDRGKPLISTEGSWHDDCQLPDLDAQASFVARQYLMLNTNHIQAHYWYNWYERISKTGSGFGTLYNPDGNGKCTSDHAGLTPAGVAYQQIYNWMVGATVSPCGQDRSVSTVYKCKFSRPSDYSAIALWDASQTCGANGCTTRTWPVPQGMGWYRDLAGNIFKIEGQTVEIGLKPILVENRSR
jgi:hypothetical protein